MRQISMVDFVVLKDYVKDEGTRNWGIVVAPGPLLTAQVAWATENGTDARFTMWHDSFAKVTHYVFEEPADALLFRLRWVS